jgi:hypothetical protein
MKPKIFTWILFATVFSLLILGGGCEKKPTPPPPPEEFIIPSTTKVLSDSTVNAMISISEDSTTMTFDAQAEKIAQLKVNDVIVSKVGYGFIRKVTSRQTSNNQIIIKTIQADLTDIIQKVQLN